MFSHLAELININVSNKIDRVQAQTLVSIDKQYMRTFLYLDIREIDIFPIELIDRFYKKYYPSLDINDSLIDETILKKFVRYLLLKNTIEFISLYFIRDLPSINDINAFSKYKDIVETIRFKIQKFGLTSYKNRFQEWLDDVYLDHFINSHISNMLLRNRRNKDKITSQLEPKELVTKYLIWTLELCDIISRNLLTNLYDDKIYFHLIRLLKCIMIVKLLLSTGNILKFDNTLISPNRYSNVFSLRSKHITKNIKIQNLLSGKNRILFLIGRGNEIILDQTLDTSSIN